MEQFSKFRADTRKPEAPPPPGSCDCQVHVFGDPAKYPLRRESAYPPPADATASEALRMHRTLGLDRGVIVQATVHGTNHRILFDALAEAGSSYRGIAIVDDSVTDQDLRRLHEAGVRGARSISGSSSTSRPRSRASFARSTGSRSMAGTRGCIPPVRNGSISSISSAR